MARRSRLQVLLRFRGILWLFDLNHLAHRYQLEKGNRRTWIHRTTFKSILIKRIYSCKKEAMFNQNNPRIQNKFQNSKGTILLASRDLLKNYSTRNTLSIRLIILSTSIYSRIISSRLSMPFKKNSLSLSLRTISPEDMNINSWRYHSKLCSTIYLILIEIAIFKNLSTSRRVSATYFSKSGTDSCPSVSSLEMRRWRN